MWHTIAQHSPTLGAAELIVGGRAIKKIEYRSPTRATKIIGERFYIYAARKWAGINGHNAEDVREGEAPTGVIVGTAIVSRCERENGHYCWHLADVERLERPRKPKRQPQPAWFRPF